MDSGDVYRVARFPLPDRRPGAAAGTVRTRAKFAVVLQGGPMFANVSDVAVVVASTRRSPAPPRPFEVAVGAVEGFDHGTIIDCRWPYTVLQETLRAGEYRFTLPAPVMQRIRAALVHGLQLLGEP